MADGSLLLIYRSFNQSDLQDRHDDLIDKLTSTSNITSMAVGSKSLTRDLRHLQNHLEAVIFVMNERGAGSQGYNPIMVTDFSLIKPAQPSPPAGTVDQLTF